MENTQCRVLLLICLFALFFIYNFTLPVMAEYMKPPILESVKAEDPSSLKTYIVYTRKPEDGVFGQRSAETDGTWYHTFLDDTTTNSNHKSLRIVHTYKSVVNGFAARLTDEEVKAMESKEGFLFAHQERVLSLHTTHTPNFLGLHKGLGLWDVSQSNQGKGIIIGLLDTGISPDHPSFRDDGMPPPPAKWKGKCEFGTAVCNNKLIGARNLINAGKNGTLPFDVEGHGTHTASTAAGSFVLGASGLGNAKGTAVGMAPYAHLAIYKVCSEYGCAESDILAAIDTAIEDGVDVLSISIGGGSSVPFYKDGTAVGAFAAMQKGIFVSCSAGNDGPKYNSLVNEAPWILTVGASTIDRRIKATAKLGNGKEYDGESLFQPNYFSSVLLPLVYAGSNGNNINSTFCAPGSLKNVDVKGKVVLCERGGDIPRIVKGKEVKNAGGVAMIIMNQKADGFSTIAEAHVLPASHVSYAAGLEIKAYINSTSKPTATILFKGTVIGDSTAPSVSSFSSRGPNLQSPGILKPDIIGPGVNILAAWPFSLDSSTIISKSTFNMISGTSMSCPHLSGIAALLKSSHPNWSPAAIKSAIMTSAYMYNLGGDLIVDQNLSPADIFATGAGHVNPSRANDPGLVYDIGPEDYVSYLCGLNYTDQQVEIIINKKVKCSEVKPISEGELNYPSFSVTLGSETQYFTRTVTNVGPANSSYNFDLYVPDKTGMSISPQTLTFTEVNQKATFRVEIIPQYGAGKDGQQFSQGYLRWVSDKHNVTSPISVVFSRVDNE